MINDEFFLPPFPQKENVEAKFTKNRAWCPDLAQATI